VSKKLKATGPEASVAAQRAQVLGKKFGVSNSGFAATSNPVSQVLW